MTREEAIKWLKTGRYELPELEQAVDLAIMALEQEPKTDRIEYGTVGPYKLTISNSKEYWQEPCEDCVSREAVLNVVERELFKGDALSKIEKLPSIQPKPKTGRWINKSHRSECGVVFIEFECSCCHKKVYDEYTATCQYCMYCGAKMIKN